MEPTLHKKKRLKKRRKEEETRLKLFFYLMPNLCVFIKKKYECVYYVQRGKSNSRNEKKGVYKKKLEIVTHIQERVRKKCHRLESASVG